MVRQNKIKYKTFYNSVSGQNKIHWDKSILIDGAIDLKKGGSSSVTLEADSISVGGEVINAVQTGQISIGTEEHAVRTFSAAGINNAGSQNYYVSNVKVSGTFQTTNKNASTTFHRVNGITDSFEFNNVTNAGTVTVESGHLIINGNLSKSDSGTDHLILGSSKEVLESLTANNVFATSNGDFYIKNAYINTFNNATATFYDTGDAKQKLAVTEINAGAGKIEVQAGSFEAYHRLNQNGSGGVYLGSAEKPLDDVRLGTDQEKALYGLRNLQGTIDIYANDVELGPAGKTAIDVFTTEGKGDATNQTTIHANNNLWINGDIYVGKASSISLSPDTEANGINAYVGIFAGDNSDVVMNGDIVTYNDPSADSQKDKVKAELEFDLSKAASATIVGSINDNRAEGIAAGTGGTSLSLPQNGTWTATGDSHVTHLTTNGSTINNQTPGQSIHVENFSGTAVVNAGAERQDDGSITTALFSVDNASDGSSVEAQISGITSDDVVGQGIDAVEGVAATTRVAGGDLYGDYVQTTDAEGNIVSSSAPVSDKLTAFKGVTASALVQWRNQINHLTKRLGDVRQQQGEIGAWARVYGGEYKWSDENRVDMKSTTVQVGGDGCIGDWIVGGAFSYTDSSFDLDNGDGDGDMYSLAVYGTRMFDSGAYIDLVARYGYIKNDLTAGNMDVDFKSNAFGVSVESGHQFKFMERAYVEPQIEVSYGYAQGDDAKASNGVKIEQDDYQSLVTRIGFRTGFDFPEDAGTIYAHASYSYDFLGDADATARKGDYRPASLDEDLGGGWVTYGIGGQFRIGQSSFAYGEIERSTGGDVENPWAFNIGFRHLF